MSGRLLAFVFLISVCLEGAVSRDSYVIVAPKTIRPKGKVRISVNILQASSDVQVQVNLVANRVVRAAASKVISPNAAGFVDLQIPDQLPQENGDYSLRVTGTGGLDFRNETTLTVDQKCVSVFVQTDKGIYKPGQTVMMRFIAYKPTLLPYNGNVEVLITDPNSNLMAKWKDISLVNGVSSSHNFPLSSEPPIGSWTISVNGDCLSGDQTFEVDKYVLPKFEVTISPSPFILSGDTTIQGTISAKYTYGKPVEGILVLTFYLPTQYYRAPPKTLRISRIPINGEYAFRVNSSKIIDIQQDYYLTTQDRKLPNWGQLAINATVTETLTGASLSGQGVTNFYDTSIKMKFHDSTPSSFKPGLMFTGRILITTQDDRPVERANVTVTPTINFDTVSAVVVEVAGGIGTFTYSIPKNTTSFKLQAVTTDFLSKKSVYATHFPKVSRSPSDSFIQLATTTSSGQPGMSLEYQVTSTFQFSEMHYQVMARGNIITQDTKKLDSSAASTTLLIAVTHEMAPSAQILAFVIKGDGEVVADSLTVSLTNAFKNKVNVTFGVAERKPGENVDVTVKAMPHSFVAVAAVDYSVTLLADTNDITQSEVLDELRSYDSSKPDWNNGPVWAFARKKRSIWWPWSPGGQDAYSVFDNAGVVILTDTTVYRGTTWDYRDGGCLFCFFRGPALAAPVDDHAEPNKGDLLEPSRVRTFFPETWLWTDATTGTNGKAIFTSKVPDTITTWVASAFAVNNVTGLGVPASGAELRAFQPFFVSLNLPYSVVRGEQLGLKVTVFNYLDVDIEDVLVELEENDNLLPVIYTVLTNEVEPDHSPDSLHLSQRVSVAASTGTTIIFAVQPRKVGPIVIRVKARSALAADAVERQLLVVPEGRAVDYTRNVFIQLDQSDTSYKESLALTLPPDVVADSGHAIVSVIGDLMGPTFNNLEQLVRMPYGCGEQNAASTAPNIFVRQYLDATHQLTFELKDKTNRYMMTGYQRELNYKHDDGSYSAWGKPDKSGSLWLTTFVTKLYALASYYVSIDSRQVETSSGWIVQQQSNTGSFPAVGRLVDTYINGGLEGDTARTAFVLISLVEARDAPSVAVHSTVGKAITKAQQYLEGRLASASDNYTICIMAYALALSGSSKTAEAITKLRSIAVIDGGSMHWTNAGGTGRKSDEVDFWYYPYHAPSAEIEMTGYALLAITATRDIAGGLLVARWLSQQRNSLGGFSSTQDTCVALEALAAYASAVHGGSGSLDITLTSDVDDDFSHSFTVNSENALVLQLVEVPAGGNLDVSASGSGTALLQATVSYNVPQHRRSQPAYHLAVNVTEKNNGNSIVVTLCSTYKKSKDSGMVVVSSVLPSGFGVDSDAMEMYMDSDQDVRRYDVSGNQVDLYLNQLVYNSKKCVQIAAVRQHDVGNVQPVPALVYSYYEPDLEKESVLYAPSGMVGVSVCDLCMRNQNCAGCDQYDQTRNITRSTVTPTLTTTRSSSVSSFSLAVTVLVFMVGVRALVE